MQKKTEKIERDLSVEQSNIHKHKTQHFLTLFVYATVLTTQLNEVSNH